MKNLKTSFLIAKDLSREFDSKARIIDSFTFTFETKKFYGLVGPSGCGKTTLLRLLAGLDIPTQGQIIYEETLWFDSSFSDSFYPPEKRQIGFVFQNFALWPHMTVFENVSFPLVVQKKSRDEIKKRCEEILSKTEILDLWDRFPHTLSGGQCQRVALSRALVTNPKILFLDEPFSALDASLRSGLRGELKALHKDWGGTSLIVTHDWADVESLCDEVIILDKGKVVQTGTPKSVFDNPINSYVRSLIGR